MAGGLPSFMLKGDACWFKLLLNLLVLFASAAVRGILRSAILSEALLPQLPCASRPCVCGRLGLAKTASVAVDGSCCQGHSSLAFLHSP